MASLRSEPTKARADVIDYMNSLLNSAGVIEQICEQHKDYNMHSRVREIRKLGLRALYEFVTKHDSKPDILAQRTVHHG